MGGVASINTDANVPPAIPMPNQAATLDNQQMSEAESQEKKFTMNADAAVFKSMYSQPTFPDQQQDGDRGFEQDSDFQGQISKLFIHTQILNHSFLLSKLKMTHASSLFIILTLPY